MDLLQNPPGLLWPSQAGILANNLLQSRLEAEGFYEAALTPGLWHHKWRSIQFCPIVDDFGIELWA
jgi:hypothetical protein